MGVGMGFAIAAAVETGKPVLAVEGDRAFGFSGMEVETICRYDLPVCVVQEGGYSLPTLAACGHAFAAGLLGEDPV